MHKRGGVCQHCILGHPSLDMPLLVCTLAWLNTWLVPSLGLSHTQMLWTFAPESLYGHLQTPRDNGRDVGYMFEQLVKKLPKSLLKHYTSLCPHHSEWGSTAWDMASQFSHSPRCIMASPCGTSSLISLTTSGTECLFVCLGLLCWGFCSNHLPLFPWVLCFRTVDC
jgi:hypothetical protein